MGGLKMDGGLVLVGCGKMGSAMLEGWLAGDVQPSDVWILEPYPSDRLKALQAQGLHLNDGLPDAPALCMLAVKPQYMKEALPQLKGMGHTVYLSIAAGISLETLAQELGNGPIIRAMPNTPAAIGRGITAIVGNAAATPKNMQLADDLLQAIGETIRLDSEDQMDAVTALSGSGPAYVFHLIETMAAAGIAEGLPAEMATKLATATVAGAGLLAAQSDETATQLRVNVTSPAGTTEAGLKVLMNENVGLPPLVRKTIKAAADRSKALRDS
ncbi:MAG: pyrroline-5-carboxylate reductase [Rhodobacteraceae bacterium]|nr:pyrroline-5-carboxylate reductase [Paracoccaceae bacterium]